MNGSTSTSWPAKAKAAIYTGICVAGRLSQVRGDQWDGYVHDTTGNRLSETHIRADPETPAPHEYQNLVGRDYLPQLAAYQDDIAARGDAWRQAGEFGIALAGIFIPMTLADLAIDLATAETVIGPIARRIERATEAIRTMFKGSDELAAANAQRLANQALEARRRINAVRYPQFKDYDNILDQQDILRYLDEADAGVWDDALLGKLNDDLADGSLAAALNSHTALIDSWRLLDEAGVDETLRRNIDALADSDAALDAIQMSQKTKPTWPEIQALFKRGNNFNKKGRLEYNYSEINLHDGKRLDSYIPGQEIVSRKATTLSEIKPSTFEGYLKELTTKYKKGKIIRSDKYKTGSGAIDGEPLSGDYYLEIPTSNKVFFESSQTLQGLAKKYGVNIKYLDE